MKKIFKNYKQTIILLISIIIGGILGIIFKEDIKILSPFGDLFLNLLLISVVPLIFLTITTSIYKMNTGNINNLLLKCSFAAAFKAIKFASVI